MLRNLAVLGAGTLMSSACTRHRYIRPAQELDLGPIKELLYQQVHRPAQAALVFRDIDGWSVLSLRCTYRGCDLTYQEPVLLCPCCRTRFTMAGMPHKGWPATVPLPWIDVYSRDGHLYANPGKKRPQAYRFTTQEIEEAIQELRARIKEEGLSDEIEIPSVLMGQGDGEVGNMFLENDPNLFFDLEMVR